MEARKFNGWLTAFLVLALRIASPPTPCLASAQESRLASLIGEIRAEVKPDQAMEYMRKVYATDRWFTFHE